MGIVTYNGARDIGFVWPCPCNVYIFSSFYSPNHCFISLNFSVSPLCSPFSILAAPSPHPPPLPLRSTAIQEADPEVSEPACWTLKVSGYLVDDAGNRVRGASTATRFTNFLSRVSIALDEKLYPGSQVCGCASVRARERQCKV